MITIITKPFLLTKDDGDQLTFSIGVHDLPDDIANHWYVRLHSNNPPPAEERPGTSQKPSVYSAWAMQQIAQQRGGVGAPLNDSIPSDVSQQRLQAMRDAAPLPESPRAAESQPSKPRRRVRAGGQ